MALKKIKQGGIIPPIAVRELSVFQQLDDSFLQSYVYYIEI